MISKHPFPRLGLPFLLLLASVTAMAQPGILTGRVTGISDGDTITIVTSGLREYKIRLNGIDAPESSQDFGQASKKNLSQLIFGREVRVAWRKQDRYDRILGRVFLGQTDVNLEQVRSGLAWFYRAYENELTANDRSLFDRVERDSKNAGRGLWQNGNPTPPWDYRAARREAGGNSLTRVSSPPTTRSDSQSNAPVRGNRNSGIYHLPECPDYEKIGIRNRVSFKNEAEAREGGFRKARNCP
ncbi:MAG: thermonuclease family protein [Blastocatellia bacterium]|jgi:endonuclease YncB( thermonuclease family)